MTEDEHREKVLSSVRRQERNIAPDGDWAHLLLIDHPDDTSVIIEVPQVPAGAKLVVGTAIRAGVSLYGQLWWALVEPVHMVRVERGEDRPEGALKDDERSIEAVSVMLGDSNPLREPELHIARVYRRARKRPHLAPFERIDKITRGLLYETVVAAVASGIAARG